MPAKPAASQGGSYLLPGSEEGEAEVEEEVGEEGEKERSRVIWGAAILECSFNPRVKGVVVE